MDRAAQAERLAGMDIDDPPRWDALVAAMGINYAALKVAADVAEAASALLDNDGRGCCGYPLGHERACREVGEARSPHLF